jgi:DNA-binding NtrC family response regulator
MFKTPTLELSTPARETRRRLTAGRVLLAEDDTEMRRLLASALRNDRYEVVEVADGKELIDQLSESIIRGQPVDCIVTDVRMPRLTGTEALRFIKGAGLMIPVIVITAFGDYDTRVDAWLLGASAVLDKPFEIEHFMDEIRRLRSGPEGDEPGTRS